MSTRRIRTSLFVAFALLIVAAAPVAAQDPSSTAPFSDGNARPAARHRETGLVRFLGGTLRDPVARAGAATRGATADGAARSFMRQYGRRFGISDAARGLRLLRQAQSGGRTFVRYQQLHAGVPVLAGEITVQLDRDRNVISASGEALPSLEVSTTPVTAPGDAAATARSITARVRDARPGELVASAPALWIYDAALAGGPATGGPRLTWRTEVTSPARIDIREFVLVDAITGRVAAHFSEVAHADPTQYVCDRENKKSRPATCTTAPYAIYDPGKVGYSTASVDARKVYDITGAAYDYYLDRLGRASVDGQNMPLRSVVRWCDEQGSTTSVCSAPMKNAFWSGGTMVYGPGVVADDIVTHELTHGVNERENKLLYWYQSGAIDESLADIFGELMDQQSTVGGGLDGPSQDWRLGEDVSAIFGLASLRRMDHPELLHHPDRMTSPYYVADPDLEDNGGVHTNSGVGNKAAYLLARPEYEPIQFNGQTIDAIGPSKTQAIYYELATNLLSSGSNYQDVFDLLPQACRNLHGTTPPGATSPIDASACVSVEKAVLATEMGSNAAVTGVTRTAGAACASESSPHHYFREDVANPATTRWAKAGRLPTSRPRNLWTSYAGYATSDPNAWWGKDYGTDSISSSNISDSTLSMTTGIRIPARAYLRFRHTYEFDSGVVSGVWTYYDGGVVEYQIAGSTAWTDARPLFVANGPSRRIATGFGNPLAGRYAFSGFIAEYTPSVASLDALAGKTVKFRFRIGTDDQSGSDFGGWLIDDIEVYTCGYRSDGTPPTASAPTATFLRDTSVAATGSTIPVRASWTASDDLSGVAYSDLQRSVNGDAFTNAVTGVAPGTAATFYLPSSTTAVNAVRARVVDGRGLAADGPPSAGFKALLYQNTAASPTLVYSSTGWTSQSLSSFSGGSAKYATVAGKKATFRFSGTDFALVSTKGKNRGRVTVRIDAQPAVTVDMYKAVASPQYRVVAFASPKLAPGSHTVTITVTTKNSKSTSTRVDLDALLVMAPAP